MWKGKAILLVVNTLLLVAVGIAAYWRVMGPVSASSPAPADLFMQSVATEDGALGWRQLCPALQQTLSSDTLKQTTAEQRAAHAEQGITLTVEYLGERPVPGGGSVRTYRATAHGPDGSSGQKMYSVKTQASGCVESVE